MTLTTLTLETESRTLKDVIAYLGTPALYPYKHEELPNPKVQEYVAEVSFGLTKTVKSEILGKRTYFFDGHGSRNGTDQYEKLKLICGGIPDGENAVLVFGRPEDNKPVGIFIQGLGDLLEAYHMLGILGDNVFYWDRNKRQFVNKRIEKPEEMIEIADAISELKTLGTEGIFEFS